MIDIHDSDPALPFCNRAAAGNSTCPGREGPGLGQECGGSVNIQIFGTEKCQDTKKAQRYFKERRIPFQFVDLTQKGLSKGELKSLKTAVGIDNLVDQEGKTYVRKNLKYLAHDIEEELLKDALLLKTPVVRNGAQATVGYQPDAWKAWK
jgi:arsenate reductase (glutaredoxin)